MNPFYVREIPVDAPFCNRERELKELTHHALNYMNVVMFSPRRFGKTSLSKRIMEAVRKKGFIPIYVDFVKVTSLEDIAGRLAAKVFEYTSKKESIFQKAIKILKMWKPVLRPHPEAGMEISVEPAGGQIRESLLEDTLKALHEFSQSEPKGCFVVLDEFQDLTNLSDSANIEGRMRSHIQQHKKVSYLFIGSRRGVLANMFQDKERAFYQSALLYPLPVIQPDVFAHFIQSQFRKAKINCPDEQAKKIVEFTHGHPYYTQKLAYFVCEIGSKKVKDTHVSQAVELLRESERLVFEVMAQAVAPKQMALLLALARQPTESIFSPAYMAKHQLGSIGGVQGSVEKLLELDYIEKQANTYKIVDPFFAQWLISISYK